MTIINDSMASVLTSLGEQVDAISYSKGRRISARELRNMYQDSPLTKKFINKTVADMLKVPREFDKSFDDKTSKVLLAAEKKLSVTKTLANALKYSSLLGDSLVVAVTDVDTDSMEKELNLDTEQIVKFLVFQQGEYTPSDSKVNSITDDNFGKPESFEINVGSKFKVHHSRCFYVKLGDEQLSKKTKKGISDIQAPYNFIKIFEATVLYLGDILKDSNVDVITIEGLNNQIAACEEENVLAYAKLMQMTKSSTGVMLLDSGSVHDQKQANYSGLSEVLSKLFSVVAGALDRPITILFGQSASGFATGEEDNRNYYETILSLQEERLRPLQEWIDKFILDLPELKSAGVSEIDFTYPSIDSVNEVERSTILTGVAASLSQLVLGDIITDSEARAELKRWGFVTTIEDDNGGTNGNIAPAWEEYKQEAKANNAE